MSEAPLAMFLTLLITASRYWPTVVPAGSRSLSAYVEKDGVTFEAVHVRGADAPVVREAIVAGITRFVLVSGIGADPNSSSPYIRARGRGELMVQRVFPRDYGRPPGAMFGPGDALFSTLAELAQLLPALPLIGSGSTRLQPVFVEDVAETITHTVLTDLGTVGRCKNSIETEAEVQIQSSPDKSREAWRRQAHHRGHRRSEPRTDQAAQGC